MEPDSNGKYPDHWHEKWPIYEPCPCGAPDRYIEEGKGKLYKPGTAHDPWKVLEHLRPQAGIQVNVIGTFTVPSFAA